MLRKLAFSAAFCMTPLISHAALILDYRGDSLDTFNGGIGGSNQGPPFENPTESPFGSRQGIGLEDEPELEEVVVVGRKPEDPCEDAEVGTCVPGSSIGAQRYRDEVAEATRQMILDLTRRERERDRYERHCKGQAVKNQQECKRDANENALSSLDGDCAQFQTSFSVYLGSGKIPVGLEISQNQLDYCMKRVDLMKSSALIQCEIDFDREQKHCEAGGL